MLLPSTKRSILVAIASLATSSIARPATYSVVDVDGGSAATAMAGQGSASTQTTTTAPPVIVSVVTETLGAPTVLVTIVQEPTQQAAPPATTTTTQPPSIITNTVFITETASAAGKTSYYDDGLWHTYYPVKDFQPPKPSPSSFTQPPSWNQTASATTASVAPALATASIQQKRAVIDRNSEAGRRLQREGGYGWSMGN